MAQPFDEKDNGEVDFVLPSSEEGTAEYIKQDRKLMRKIDLHIMPLLMITYGIQYSDKISLSSGAVFDLRENTHLVGAQYAWLTTIFYLTYLVGEVPVGWFMQRFRIDRILAYCVLVWGICVLCLAACKDFKDRAILGFAECAVSPGFLVFVSAWYKREEQIIRSLMFFAMNSFFSLFILMCCYGIGRATYGGSGLEAWRVINLFLGSLSLAWGFVMVWRLGTPAHVTWLTSEERERLRIRLLTNNSGEVESGVKVNWKHVVECFVDPQVYFQIVFMFLICVASGGITAFSALIVKSFGFGGAESIALQLPWYFITFSCVMATIFMVYKYPHKNWNLLLAIGFMIPAIIGILLQGLLPSSRKWGRLIGYWITGPYVVNQFLLMAVVSQNTAGRTKKSMVQALTFISYCVGFLVGPQFYWASSAPQYLPGLYSTAACFIIGEFVLVAWFFWARASNRARDRAVAGMTLEAQVAEGIRLGELDTTDRLNPHFRYKY